MPVRRLYLAVLAFAAVAALLPSLVAAQGVPSEEAQTPVADAGFVPVDGAQVYYHAVGEGDPLVLVHGYPLSGDLFWYQRQALSDTYRVITVDLRGYGRSEGASEAPAGIETYATDVLAVMDHLGIERAIIGGMSMGGPIVFSMYQQAPERFDGIILTDTIAAAANPIERGTWLGTVELIQQEGPAALPPLLIDDMLTGETRLDRPEFADYLVDLMNQASTQAMLDGAMALANRPDFTSLLPSIDVPVLVIAGLQDPIYPVEISIEMFNALADATLVVIDNASHAAIFEGAVGATDAIRTWAARVPAATE
jgi:pimeloyl-ACP methyl ester carboxylesterase